MTNDDYTSFEGEIVLGREEEETRLHLPNSDQAWGEN